MHCTCMCYLVVIIINKETNNRNSAQLANNK
jgi:hypothetical protein